MVSGSRHGGDIRVQLKVVIQPVVAAVGAHRPGARRQARTTGPPMRVRISRRTAYPSPGIQLGVVAQAPKHGELEKMALEIVFTVMCR
jgi:hypothetical protein